MRAGLILILPLLLVSSANGRLTDPECGVWTNPFGPQSAQVSVLATVDVDDAGPLPTQLVAVRNGVVSRWDNSAWQPMGVPGVQSVQSIVSWDADGSGPQAAQLIAGGIFLSPQGNNYLMARWNGATWEQLGHEFVQDVESSFLMALVPWDADGSGPDPQKLIGGGVFRTLDGVSVNHIGEWNGVAWSSLGGGIQSSFSDPNVSTMTQWDPDGDGPQPRMLVIGGNFTSAGGVPVRHVAYWDGSAWHDVGGGIQRSPSSGKSNVVRAVASWDPDGVGPLFERLVVGGIFEVAGEVAANNVAMWDGVSWQPLGQGTNGAVDELLEWDPDGDGPSSPQLIAGGAFSAADAQPANRIARWNGVEWSGMGGGVVLSQAPMVAWDPDGSGRFKLVSAARPTELMGSDLGTWITSATPPKFSEVPENAAQLVGATVELEVVATPDVMHYRWRKNGVELADGLTAGGSVLSGTATAAMSIDNAVVSDSGTYDCLARNPCGPTKSAVATVAVFRCWGDANSDGAVNNADLSFMLGVFGASTDNLPEGARVDFNADGTVNAADLSVLLSNFGSKCVN